MSDRLTLPPLLVSLFLELKNRPTEGYVLAVESQWSPYAVSKLLKRHGVETWGWKSSKNRVQFRLRRKQMDYAEYLMDSYMIPWIDTVSREKAKHRWLR